MLPCCQLTLFVLWFAHKDKDSFLLKLEDTENWLYEEGEDQQKQVYVDRLSSLKVDFKLYYVNCLVILASLMVVFCFDLIGFLSIPEKSNGKAVVTDYFLQYFISLDFQWVRAGVACGQSFATSGPL